ncbi:amino acid adenylation domain-containing protein, partial [Lysobacter maris]
MSESIVGLLREVEANKVVLHVENGKLAFIAAEGGFPENLKKRVVAAKQALIEYLLEEQASDIADRVDALSVPGIVASAGSSGIPLSFGQARLWTIDKLDGGSSQYNLSTVLRVEGDLDMRTLESALAGLIRRHDVLRTRFVDNDGWPSQEILDRVAVPLRTVDLRHLPEGERDAEARRLMQVEASTPFDLGQGTLLRTLVVVVGDGSYRVLFAHHHIVSDGWSIAVLLREFSELYTATYENRAHRLPPLSIRYADYAVWQREQLHCEDFQRQLDYWDNQLRGIPALHALPLDRPRPADRSFEGACHRQILAPELCGALRGHAQTQGATLFMVLQTAFALLLARLSQERDIVVGTPVAGRILPELEPLMGFFVNSLVLRTRLVGNPSWRELLAAQRKVVVDAFEHQHVPFDMLIERLNPERGLGHDPVFQIVFGFNNNAQESLSLPGLRVDLQAADVELAKTDIEVTVMEHADGLSIDWNYRVDLFDEATIAAFCRAYAVLLEGVVADADRPVFDIPLMSQSDIDIELGYSRGPGCLVERQGIGEVFSSVADERSDADAMICGERRMSYAALDSRSDRMARYLRAMGVRDGARIGISLPRSMEQLIAVMGVLKAGAAYVPIELDLPRGRVAAIVADAGIEWMLVVNDHVVSHSLSGVDLLLMDGASSDAGWMAEFEDGEPLPTVPGSALAYVLYTSGSSGTPKGVMISHAAALNYLRFAARRYLDDDIVGGVVSSPLGFDATMTTLLAPLMAGKPIRLLPDGEDALPELAKCLFTGGEGWLFKITPAHLEALSYLAGSPCQAPHRVVVGGEQLLSATLRQWKGTLLPRGRFVNEYGPTEATVGCSICEIASEEDLGAASVRAAVAIGHPIDGAELYVIGEGGALQPPGAIGELHIGGAGLAAGYCNLPTLSTERFVSNPVAPGRVYRSGDLVRRLPDGQLEFVCRKDEQVKLRGFRIELGEIEHVLRSVDGVHDAVVAARQRGTRKEQHLVAYVVVTEMQANVVDRCWSALSQHLPDYMRPSALMVMDSLPLTSNGKVDRKALPEPPAGEGRGRSAPGTETERLLCEVWGRVLQREDVGVDDNFFALGGDSILAIQMVASAGRAGLTVTTRQLFANQTIAQLAAQVALDEPSPMAAQDVDGETALLPVQRRFLADASGLRDHYNQAFMLTPPEGFDESALRAMIEVLLRRHDALRLRFRSENGGWIASHAALTDADVVAACSFEEIVDGVDVEAKVASICETYQSTLDIGRGPLIRAVLFGGAVRRLLIVIHHLVVDAVSWQVLLGDVEQAWKQYVEGRSLRVSPKTTSFQQWAQALLEMSTSEHVAAQRGYWQAQAERNIQCHTQALVRDTRYRTIVLDEERTSALLTVCQTPYRTRVDEFLVAAVFAAVRRWLGVEALTVDMEHHGRDIDAIGMDVSETIGWFTTIFPLRLECPATDPETLICAVKEAVRAVPDKGVGFGLLRDIVGDPSLSQKPSLLLFNYLGRADAADRQDAAFSLANDAPGATVDGNRLRSHRLIMNGAVRNGRLTLSLEYAESEYAGAVVDELAGLVSRELAGLIDHCAGRQQGRYTPSDFPLANVDSRMLDAWQARHDLVRLYSATAMQQGMWFHSLIDRSAYVTQLYLDIQGDLDVSRLRAAWQAVVDRYDIFRTLFVGEGAQQHQLVLRAAGLPWQEVDWRGLDATAQEVKFETLRGGERERGFDPELAPLMRVVLCRTGEQHWRMLWSHHHSLLDGWSSAMVHREVLRNYFGMERSDLAQGAAEPYETYVSWLQRRDRTAALDYWRMLLAPVLHSTALPGDCVSDSHVRHGNLVRSLGSQASRALHDAARAHNTTVNTLVQFAWALLLSRLANESSAVFGAVVSGRPTEIAGVERMVGLFINTIPVVVDFQGDEEIAGAVAALHRQFSESAEHGWLPLAEITRRSGIAAGTSLFESILVFENYPLEEFSPDASLRIENVVSDVQDTYPLALGVFDGDEIEFSCNYFADRFTPAAIRRLLQRLCRILVQLPTCRRVSELSLVEAEELTQLRDSRNATEVAYDARPVQQQIAEQAQRTPASP